MDQNQSTQWLVGNLGGFRRDRQFAACESDRPSLSCPDRFVEGGVSLGAVVIKQGDHPVCVRGTRNPSDGLHRADFRCLMCSKKVRPSLKARKVVGRERRAQNWGQPKTARLLSPKTLWTRRRPSGCRLAGLFASGRVYQNFARRPIPNFLC